MKLALDTNRYTELARGRDPELEELVESALRVFLPFVVLAELRAGFSLGTRGRENERFLRAFLRKPGVEPLFPTEVTIRHYAALYRQLRVQGTPIPTNDLWIAALAVENDATLATHDRHFEALPQLALA